MIKPTQLTFADTTGLERTFCSFRLGSFYSTRLKPGSMVELYDLKASSVIGKAMVLYTVHEPIGQALLRHAQHHHSMLAVAAPLAPKTLLKALRAQHRDHPIDRFTQITVVYLARSSNETRHSSSSQASQESGTQGNAACEGSDQRPQRHLRLVGRAEDG